MKQEPTEVQKNKDKYNYYTTSAKRTYNYGKQEGEIYSIYRVKDDKLLQQFSLIDFKSIKVNP